MGGASGPFVGRSREEGVLVISDTHEAQLMKDMRTDSYLSLATGALILPLSLLIIFMLAADLL